MDLTNLKQRLRDGFNAFVDTLVSVDAEFQEEIASESTERAVSVFDILSQVNTHLWGNYPDDYLYASDLVEEERQLYAIVNYEGRIWRATVDVEGSQVKVGSLVEVEMTYTPVEAFARQNQGIQVIRSQDGNRYWLRVVSAAVVLRGSKLEIDSVSLMDSFLRGLEGKTADEMPIASIWHEGKGLRVGQSIRVWREDKLLCDFGKWDDTELAQRHADHVEANPDFWGTSIEYYRTGIADVEDVAGTKLIVNREGILTQCDFLPEKQAASLLTGGIAIQRGHAMKKEVKDLLEEMKVSAATIEAFDAEIRSRNDVAATMVTREAEPTPEPALEPQPEPIDVELTEEDVAEIVRQVVTQIPPPVVGEEEWRQTQEAINTLTQHIETLQTRLTTTEAELATVRATTERTDDERLQELARNAPAPRKIFNLPKNPAAPETPQKRSGEAPVSSTAERFAQRRERMAN